MSALVQCGECNGTGKKNRKTCEWCEGTGQIEVPDGFRSRHRRTKADLKRIAEDQEVPHESPSLRKPDTLVVKAPPARMTIKKE